MFLRNGFCYSHPIQSHFGSFSDNIYIARSNVIYKNRNSFKSDVDQHQTPDRQPLLTFHHNSRIDPSYKLVISLDQGARQLDHFLKKILTAEIALVAIEIIVHVVFIILQKPFVCFWPNIFVFFVGL
ncbi:unnamed protein product [Pseudo-nitzschia multistriata]|uniref:Uncharacterized protein n=1 Tax=Pseudo-nitzschia multistriata TaxID=183589 RepID=A0A448ZKE9_9STRA|nr:unnamed protein product [Pseudo-nitzschia multistriata]